MFYEEQRMFDKSEIIYKEYLEYNINNEDPMWLTFVVIYLNIRYIKSFKSNKINI